MEKQYENIIIGIDPGTNVMGYALLGVNGKKPELIVMGVLRLGKLIRFIPGTITIGFTAGIAVTILIGQLKDFFGLTYPAGTVTIETVEKIGTNLGKGLAGLINIFNPELVVIGGKVTVAAGDYLMLPIRTSIKRHALNIANQDTTIKRSKLMQQAAPIGAALLVRGRILGML